MELLIDKTEETTEKNDTLKSSTLLRDNERDKVEIKAKNAESWNNWIYSIIDYDSAVQRRTTTSWNIYFYQKSSRPDTRQLMKKKNFLGKKIWHLKIIKEVERNGDFLWINLFLYFKDIRGLSKFFVFLFASNGLTMFMTNSDFLLFFVTQFDPRFASPHAPTTDNVQINLRHSATATVVETREPLCLIVLFFCFSFDAFNDIFVF